MVNRGEEEEESILSGENERATRWRREEEAVGVVCDIARCKLQFCCEIIIKYIMPSRLLPRATPPLSPAPPPHYPVHRTRYFPPRFLRSPSPPPPPPLTV